MDTTTHRYRRYRLSSEIDPDLGQYLESLQYGQRRRLFESFLRFLLNNIEPNELPVLVEELTSGRAKLSIER